MLEQLKKLQEKSYSPYSKFRVAAILKMKDGNYITGVNIENASYGASVCAERVAILKAISEGYKKGDFDTLYVLTDSHKISSCCFLCRQVITEFMEPDNTIVLYDQTGNVLEVPVSKMCPFPFDKEDLYA